MKITKWIGIALVFLSTTMFMTERFDTLSCIFLMSEAIFFLILYCCEREEF